MINSIYFTHNEIKCKCGTPECDSEDIDARFLLRVDRIRHRFDKPLIVNSGVRCKKHNMLVGGSPRSMHLVGKALDLSVSKEHQDIFIKICVEEGITGIGLADNWCHIDDKEVAFRSWSY